MTVAEAFAEQAARIRRIPSDQMQGAQAAVLRAFVAAVLGSLVVAGPFALHLATSAALGRKLARRLSHRFGAQVRMAEVAPSGLLHPGLRISGLEMTWKDDVAGASVFGLAPEASVAAGRSRVSRLVAPLVELQVGLTTRRLERVVFHHVWIDGRARDLARHVMQGTRHGRPAHRSRTNTNTRRFRRGWGSGGIVATLVFKGGGFLMSAGSGLHVLGGFGQVTIEPGSRAWVVSGKAAVALRRGQAKARARLAGRLSIAVSGRGRGALLFSGKGGRWRRWAASHLSVRRLALSKVVLSWPQGQHEMASWVGGARIVELAHGLNLVEARFGRGTKSALSFRVIADLARQRYEVHSQAHGIDAGLLNRRLMAMLTTTKSEGRPVFRGVNLRGASLAWNIDGRRQSGAENVTGTIHLAGPVTVSRRWLASRPVSWRHLEVTATGAMRKEQGTVVVDLTKVSARSRKMSMEFVGRISRRRGVTLGVLRARLPQTGCQSLLSSLPSGLAPALDGMVLSGRVGADLLLSARSDRLSDLQLRTGLSGPGCQVIRDPDHGDVHRLIKEHVIAARDRKGRPMQWVIGPSNRAFRPLTRLPHHLVRAFMMTEDRRFFRHRGFNWEQIRRALAFDLEHGALIKGASTISQQVVKNEFLTQHKTFARKLQEAVLTWRLEQVVPKARILEVYLNLVEMGPGIYGVARGARTYFGRDVRWITPMQSLHLAAITPSPRRYYRDFHGGRINMTWLLRLKGLLHRMYRSGMITEPEYAKSRTRKFYLAAF